MEVLFDYLMLLKGYQGEKDNTCIGTVSNYILELLYGLYEDDSQLFQEVYPGNDFKGFQAKCRLLGVSPWDDDTIRGVQKILNDPGIQEKLCDKQFYSRHKI